MSGRQLISDAKMHGSRRSSSSEAEILRPRALGRMHQLGVGTAMEKTTRSPSRVDVARKREKARRVEGCLASVIICTVHTSCRSHAPHVIWAPPIYQCRLPGHTPGPWLIPPRPRWYIPTCIHRRRIDTAQVNAETK